MQKNASRDPNSSKEQIISEQKFEDDIQDNYLNSLREGLSAEDSCRKLLQKHRDSGDINLIFRSFTFSSMCLEKLVLENAVYTDIDEVFSNNSFYEPVPNRMSSADQLITIAMSKDDQFLTTLHNRGFQWGKVGDNLKQALFYLNEKNSPDSEDILSQIVATLNQQIPVAPIELGSYEPEELKAIDLTNSSLKKGSRFPCFSDLSISNDSKEVINFCRNMDGLLKAVSNQKIENGGVAPKSYSEAFQMNKCLIQPTLKFDNYNKLIAPTQNEDLLDSHSHVTFNFRPKNSSNNEPIIKKDNFKKFFNFAKDICPGFILVETKPYSSIVNTIEKSHQENLRSDIKDILEIKNINLDRYECLFDDKPLSC